MSAIAKVMRVPAGLAMADREGLPTPVPVVPLTQAQVVAVIPDLEDQPIRALEGQPIPDRAGLDTTVREGRPMTGQVATHIPVRAAPATPGPAGLATRGPAGAKVARSCVVENCVKSDFQTARRMNDRHATGRPAPRRPDSFCGSRSRDCRTASKRGAPSVLRLPSRPQGPLQSDRSCP